MIFPKGCGAITVLAEHLSQWGYTIGTDTRITGKGSSQLHDSSCIVYVVVAAGTQSRGRDDCQPIDQYEISCACRFHCCVRSGFFETEQRAGSGVSAGRALPQSLS